MERLEVSGAVRPIYGSLGVKRLSRCPAGRAFYGYMRLTCQHWCMVNIAEREPILLLSGQSTIA